MIRRIARAVALVSVSLGLVSMLFAATPPGYSVNGRFLYDPCGQKTILKGVNAMIVYWDRDGTKDYPEIARTGANCCRIMWHWDYPAPTAAELDSTLQHCINNKMIPIPGVWAATGDWSQFQACVDYWCSDSISAVVKKHEKHMILNIANEPGSGTIPDDQFRTYYKNAVTQIRNAGIHAALLCDATNWGRDENSVINNGPYLLEQDPDHNLLFAWHLYDPSLNWTGTQDRIKSAIDRSITANICMIVGEFGFSEQPGVPGKEIEWRYMIQYATQNQIGWLPWCWKGDGLSMTPDYAYANLNAWGLEVGVTNPYSIKNTAERTPYLLTLTCGGVSAQFTTDKTSGAMPLIVSFDGSQSTGTNRTCAWRFGDGGTSTQEKPQHTYTAAGSFTVVLTVASGSDQDSAKTTITVADPATTPTEISCGKTAVASSEENSQFGGFLPAVNAVDCSMGTRWSSNSADNEWICVDLGSVKSFGRVILRWEAAYASSYKAQVSNDKQAWTDLASVTNGNGGDDTLAVNGNGRYVRMLGITRATGFGYSLYEFEIFQMPAATSIGPAIRHSVSNAKMGDQSGHVRSFSLNGMLQPAIRQSANKRNRRPASSITIVQGANAKLHANFGMY